MHFCVHVILIITADLFGFIVFTVDRVRRIFCDGPDRGGHVVLAVSYRCVHRRVQGIGGQLSFRSGSQVERGHSKMRQRHDRMLRNMCCAIRRG